MPTSNHHKGSHVTTPRDKPPLTILLTAGKRRADVDWLTIESDLDIRRGTREAWLNGTTTRLPLIEILELCAYLKITPEECAQAVLHHVLPRWVHEHVGGAQVQTLSERENRRQARQAAPRTPRRRRSNGPHPA
jgi:hypothetical protein